MWIAERAENKASKGRFQNYDPDALVETMFSGPKEALRPIYDHIIKLTLRLGKDVTITPCSTIVPLRRQYVFAEIKPSTKTRIDLGFALKDTSPSKRLLETGGRAKGNRITHKIPITSIADVDNEVKGWLKKAYDLDE